MNSVSPRNSPDYRGKKSFTLILKVLKTFKQVLAGSEYWRMNNTVDAMCLVWLTGGREGQRGASLLQSRKDLPLTQTESHSIAAALTITCTESSDPSSQFYQLTALR